MLYIIIYIFFYIYIIKWYVLPHTEHTTHITVLPHIELFLFLRIEKMELFDLYLPFNLLLTVDYMPYLKVACDKQWWN